MCEKLGIWGGRESKHNLVKGLGGASCPPFIEMDGYREKIYLHSKELKNNSARHYLTEQWYILMIRYNTSPVINSIS